MERRLTPSVGSFAWSVVASVICVALLAVRLVVAPDREVR
jgi:hypothetical protein